LKKVSDCRVDGYIRIDEASRIEEARRESKNEGKIEAAKIMLELGHSKAEIIAKLGLKETDF